MIKKIFIALVIVIALGMGVRGVVSTTHAQEIEPEDVAVDPFFEPVSMENEYEYAYQYGYQNGDNNPVMTQTRTRTQLRELQEDGDCSGNCDPQQLRQNLGADKQEEMRGQRLNLDGGAGNGDCVRISQQGSRGK